MRKTMAAALAMAAVAAMGPASTAAAEDGRVAVLRGLDKVSGQYKDFEAPVGRVTKFQTLEIAVRACRKAPPEEPPATWVYVEITDNPVRTAEGAKPKPVKMMAGWMLAESPALNGLEHPVYDVWAKDCRA
jgi:hypothetical protein